MAVPVFFVTVKYGKIPEEDQAELLPEVDFSLPSDHDDTKNGLASGLSQGAFEVRAGGTMWM